MIIKKVFEKSKTSEIRQFSLGDKIYVRGFDPKTDMPVTRQYEITLEISRDAYLMGFNPIEQPVISVRNDEQRSIEKE
jgi:hypothetical protein